MAEPAPKMLRYLVTGPLFHNGSLIDPAGKEPIYLTLPEGYESRSLKLAPLAEKPPAPAQDEKKV
ncbi:MAG: hypothetical protein ACRCXM_15770 [Beijerinckiaceae bacterium]